MGANDTQAIRALREAESYRGPSIVLAYSPCIEHGFQMQDGVLQQKRAVDSGYWPLYRFNPALAEKGQSPMQLDCRAPSLPLADYLYSEGRYRSLRTSDPELAAKLLIEAEEDARQRWEFLETQSKKVPLQTA
jgi:pyruvate-ferredoxin/flavodoxin oxidoreductase